MQSYRSRLTDSVMSPGGNVIGELAATTKIIEDQRESVKSQVEKLYSTRKEIKKLIKI